MKIGFLTMEKWDRRKKGSVGSSRIRGDWVMKFLEGAEEFNMGSDYDVVIYQKAYWEEHIKAFKGIKIFDLCDPDWLEGRPLVELGKYVDAFTVPTEALKNALNNYLDIPVYVVPDRMDLEFYSKPKPKHEGLAKSCVYFGYSHNARKVLPQTLETLKEMNINLTVISESSFTESGFYNISNVPYDNDTVNAEIIKHDFVLLPEVENDMRFSFKSNNKTVSSWLLKMPVVKTEEDFERFLHPEARQKEADEKYAMATEQYDVRKSAEQFKQIIEELKAKKNVQ